MTIRKYAQSLLLLCMSLLVLAACSEGQTSKKEEVKAPQKAEEPAQAAPEKAAPAAQAPAAEEPKNDAPTTGSGGNMTGQNAPSGDISEKDLLHRRFVLVSINGEPYSAKEKAPTIEFLEDFRIAGSVCNSFMGKAELKDGTLSSKNMAATRKLCFEEAINKLEADFHKMMTDGSALEFDGKKLLLRGKGYERDLVLEYEPADWVR